MPLPRGDEYNQAVQSPRVCFSDSVLQSCHVETTPLGLPKPYSGGFTTTYRLLNSSNSWAVRCFTREISDLQRRYKAIGAFLKTNSCPILVEAEYLANGIRVNGVFHPIIKMQWLDGETLNVHIGRIHKNNSSIQHLLTEFVDIVKTLERFGIAHGDLQHGNIIVKNHKLYLIDYDGMFFPDLSSLKVNELGHPNFQHPRRTTNDYNKNIDRFAALVIYTALKAISITPSLWDKFDNGDNLLFKGKDFSDPANSPLIRELISHPELTKLAKNLVAISTWEFIKIPTLNDFITNTYTPSTVLPPVIGVPRSPYPIVDGTQKGRLGEYIGQKVMVIGRISAQRYGSTKYGDPYLFMNFGIFPNQTFTIVLWKEALEEFKRNKINPDTYKGAYISVIGVLGTYSGTPQMSIDFTNQIQLLSGAEEVRQYLSNSIQESVIQNPRTQRTTAVTKIDGNDEKLNKIYERYPVTPSKPSIQTRPSYQPIKSPSTPSTSSRGTHSSTQKTQSNSNTGCTIMTTFTLIGALIGAIALSVSNGIGGGIFVGGGLFGGIIGAVIGFIIVIIVNNTKH
jgi:serine/threonine protein kinase